MFNKFILNKFGNLISLFDSKYYVLLLSSSFVSFNIYSYFNISFDYYISCNWCNFWKNRFDYIFSNYKIYLSTNDFVSDSIDYFIGILNTSIQYCSFFSDYKSYAYLSYHDFSCFDDISNPLNIKVDLLERSIGEYIKYMILCNTELSLIFDFISKYKNICNFNLVISRILYPNYYFDLLDSCILNNCSYDELNKIIKNIDNIEFYLREIINFISKFYKIKKISYI